MALLRLQRGDQVGTACAPSMLFGLTRLSSGMELKPGESSDDHR